MSIFQMSTCRAPTCQVLIFQASIFQASTCRGVDSWERVILSLELLETGQSLQVALAPHHGQSEGSSSPIDVLAPSEGFFHRNGEGLSGA